MPAKLQYDALRNLHVSHLGIVKCKSLARMCMWWAGLDEDLEKFIKSCEACAALRPSPPKASLINWQNSGKPWSRVHVDYAGPIEKQYFLIITDSFSKWPEVFKTKTITAEYTIRKLREVFARFGLPEMIVSDAGTQFTSAAFKEFLSNNGIQFVVISPGHPASNGAAENAVKSFKKGLQAALATAKASKLSMNIEAIMRRYLFDFRNSIHCSIQEKPSRVMFGRDVRTRFAQMKPSSVRENIDSSLLRQAINHGGRRNQLFEVNDLVMIRDYTDVNHPSWTKANIVEVLGNREYNCKILATGRIIKRHLDQIFSFDEINADTFRDVSTDVVNVDDDKRDSNIIANESTSKINNTKPIDANVSIDPVNVSDKNSNNRTDVVPDNVDRHPSDRPKRNVRKPQYFVAGV